MKRRQGAGNPISTGLKKILGGRGALVHDAGVLTPDPAVIKDSLCAVSRQLGFSGCRVARAGRSPHAENCSNGWNGAGTPGWNGWRVLRSGGRTLRRCFPAAVPSSACPMTMTAPPCVRRGREASAFTPTEGTTTEFWKRSWRICRNCFPFTAASKRDMWTPDPSWNGTTRKRAAWDGAEEAA